MAYTAKGQLAQADRELTALQSIVTNADLESISVDGLNSADHVLRIAIAVLSGELAVQQGRVEDAIAHFQQGVELEDNLQYMEPPSWYSPVRQTLGAALLRANRPSAAEQVYRADLALYPENGWSLYGLAQSLRAQGKTQEAQQVQARFEQAWQYADAAIAASRL